MANSLIGIIGGSGLYEMEGLKIVDEVRLETPFGMPSDAYLIGELEGQRIAFLPRHGRGHLISPSELNFRANIWGMKKLGVDRLIGVSAVGSMREEIRPGDMVIVDQFIDRTKGRVSTFFNEGIVAHVSFADPLCPSLRRLLIEATRSVGARLHEKGTYLCMEGPQFSTRAESHLYRSWGVDVIGMTNLQEAKLAREAELCYATIALSTDYDCWHETHEDVTADGILKVLRQNVETAQKIIRRSLQTLNSLGGCECHSALKSAILSRHDRVSAPVRKRLELILSKYF